MKHKLEIEIETAVSILANMAGTLDDLEARWAPSKRGTNAQRALTSLHEQRKAAADCLEDAIKAATSFLRGSSGRWFEPKER